MNTAKALIAGLVVTVGLLAATFGLEAMAQLVGDFPEEEETFDLDEEEGGEGTGEGDDEDPDEGDDIDLTDEEG